MKTHFILAGFLGLVMGSATVQGQNLVWAKQYGGSSNESGESIAVDAAGNVYTTGYFSGTVDFDPGPGTLNLTSAGVAGNRDVFVTKLDPLGDLVWAIRLGGTYTDWGRSIAVDDTGNIYVTGTFMGAADFDPGIGTFNLASDHNYTDVFITKLNSSGNLIWAKQFAGSSNDNCYSIAVDASGNVYTTGSFQTSVNFNGIQLNADDVDAFIVKMNAAGNTLWAKQFRGPRYEHGYAIAVDLLGNVYTTGSFLDNVDFDPGPDTFNLTANSTIGYISKLDSSGDLVWAQELVVGVWWHYVGMSVVVDAFGNIYSTGTAFISKLGTAGNLIWSKQFAGMGAYNGGQSIVADNTGNIFATGYFTGTVDFDTGPGTYNLTSAGKEDIFISQFDSSGNLIWARSLGGDSTDKGYCVAVDVAGNVHVTGSFQETADFAPGPSTFNLASIGNDDVFVLKLRKVKPYIVQGQVFGDINNNCTSDTSDNSIPGMLIKAEPGQFYGMSDLYGNYAFYLFDTGSYTISVATQDSLWQPSCTTSYNIHVTTFPDTANGIDFAMNADYYCPRLTVELGTSFLRPCFNSTYTIRYGNTGTLPASNAYIEVDFGDNLQPQSSTLSWSTVSDNVYTFPIGNLNVNQQGSFTVTALLDCNARIGSTQCVTAHIYPDSSCFPPQNGWDKSDTKVTGGCVNDSLVCFMIKNRSSPPSGNMQGAAPWRLYINDTLVSQGNYQLAGGDSLIQCYPANGKTYRLEADQRLGHPGNSHPQAIVETCGSPDNFGFVNTVPQDDEDLFVETFCIEVRGSYDPNDKQVFPTGITANKYIKPDAELEYLIRFQNTGNDTAFKVVIRDTIQTDVIDIATLTSGASSHDYTFNIYGHGIAEWTFDNILLPDSNVNEPESHGFVKFKAKLLPNIAPGTLVTNSADIYFDFNAPVITNEVWNTVFDTVLRAPVTISGAVVTESNEPVAGVTVKLTGSATDSTITTADGRYGFEVEPGGDYTVTPSKNNDAVPNKGLTTYDILTIRKHLLAIGALPSPYKIISASEVNAEADTSVTTQDIVLIRSLILGNTSSFPGSRLWQFVSSDYLFPDMQHPFPFTKTRTYTNLLSNQTDQNFIGIKLGDVNESWEE